MKPTKKKIRSFTLEDIRDSIEGAILNAPAEATVQGFPGHCVNALRSPSMPTLKNWSRDGVFKNTPTLEGATLAALGTLAANAKYYGRSKSKPQPGQQPADIAPPSASPFDSALIFAKLEAMSSRMSNLELALNARPAPGATNPAVEQGFTQLTTAINQLDATRRHVMLRMDSELQARQGSAGRAFDGPSALDAQRILARLSNVEELLQKILIAN